MTPAAIEPVTVTGGGGGGGGGATAFLTVTPTEVRAREAPDALNAVASSVCEPSASVVVSSLPVGSPLNWYGA